MTSLGIGHDWAHCEGTVDCPLRDNCIRYLLHMEALDEGLSYVTYVFPMYKEGGCRNFWEKNNDKKS